MCQITDYCIACDCIVLNILALTMQFWLGTPRILTVLVLQRNNGIKESTLRFCHSSTDKVAWVTAEFDHNLINYPDCTDS